MNTPLRERVKDAWLLWPQWLAAITVSVLCMSIGFGAGWTSPYLVKLTAKDSPIPITPDEASWIASLLPLGRFVGAICGSLLTENFGSKVSLVLTGIPLMFGWLSMMCATSATWLYVYRILAGTSMGMIITCFPLFIGEISSPHIRGALVGVVINSMPLGTLFGNIMGANLSMTWFGMISLTITLCYMLVAPILPKSPYYLVRKNAMEKAAESIRFYYRKTDDQTELEIVEETVRDSEVMSYRERLRLMKEKKNRRAFVVIVTLFVFMQLSGLNTIVFYMETIIRDAKVTCLNTSTVVIMVSFVGIILGWIAIYAIDRCGRRLLLCMSSLGVLSGMILLGIHFLLLDLNYNPHFLQPLPIVAMMLVMMICVGIIPVPGTLLSEMFPLALKSIAGLLCSVTAAFFAFLSSKTYQWAVDLTARQYVFWMYGSVMGVCFVYSMLKVPETKGKTLLEIQNMLAKESLDEEQGAQRNED